MIVSRRTILKGGAAASAALSMPALSAEPARILITCDSRIPESRAFAARHRRESSDIIDLANSDAHQWSDLRKAISGKRHIVGLTGWTDWVIARGFMEERGLRLSSQTSVPAPLSGKAHLFRWEMRV